MLTDQEQLAFRESIGRVQNMAAGSLRKVGDAGRAVAFIANLHRGLDHVALRAAELGPVPDCQAGCAYCCFVRVEATEPEVFLIAQRVRLLPENQVAGLIDKLRRRVAEYGAGLSDTRVGCAFLVEGRCSIYEARPAACRKAHSLSVRQCAELAAEIPQNLKLIAEAEALMAGTSNAYREVGLPASPLELNSAVLLALSDASAESRWFKGETVF